MNELEFQVVISLLYSTAAALDNADEVMTKVAKTLADTFEHSIKIRDRPPNWEEQDALNFLRNISIKTIAWKHAAVLSREIANRLQGSSPRLDVDEIVSRYKRAFKLES